MYTYVLELAGGNIYVGRTINLHKRLRDHWKGRGARWVRLHPPRRLLDVQPGDVETATTIRYFKLKGLLVRGGPWCQVRLNAVPRSVFQEEMATLATQTSIKDWTVQPAVKNSHNSLVWPITVSQDSRAAPKVQCGQDDTNSLRIPFGTSKFSETSKTCLDYSIAPWQSELLAFWRSVDDWVVDYVFNHQKDFFKKPYATKEQLRDNYCPLVSQKDDYEPLLKTKVGNGCSIFAIDASGSRKGTVDDIKPGSAGVPIISVTSLWTMSGRFGVSAHTQALMLWPKLEKSMGEIFQTNLSFNMPMDVCP